MATDLPLIEDPCCTAALAVPALDDADIATAAKVFKALGDPTRLKLLALIATSKGGEACICDLTDPVGLSQPTVSHHMKQLVEAGLASRDQRGKWAYFRADESGLSAVRAALATLDPPTPV